MRIFTAQLITETNTFSPLPTVLRDYEEMGIHHGTASTTDPDGVFAVLTQWRRLGEAAGHVVVEGLAAQAQPGGRTLRKVYEAFRADIVGQLATQAPIDMVLLNMHGAMSAEGYDDCEGDLLEHIRAVVGPDVAIGVELDLHCHMTARIARTADIVIAYKHYPHSDIADRAAEVFALTAATAEGKVRPVISLVDCHMVGMWHTTREPMAGFVGRMAEREDGTEILNISFGHGFPWGDVDEGGARMWVITNDRKDLGDQLALELANEIFDLRNETMPSLLSIDAALDVLSEATSFPIVAADGADNPGGGAPSDSNFVLERIIARQAPNALVAYYYDPELVKVLAEVGPGAKLDVRIGGKISSASGNPIDLAVEVMAVLNDHHQTGFNQRWPLGTAVWLRGPHELDLVLTSVRSQPFDPDSLTLLGIDLAAKHLIVVKSIQHFHALFAPIAAGGVIYLKTPGALTPDFANVPYLTKSLEYWPRREGTHPVLLQL